MDSNTQPQYSENNNQVWECLPTTSNYVDQIAFSPDGKILASLHNRSLESLKIWDLVSGELLYAANEDELLNIAVDKDSLYDYFVPQSLYFSPNGKGLVCILGGIVLIYDLELGKVVRGKSVKSPFDRSYFGRPHDVLVSPNLQIAATTHYGYTNLWEISTEKKIHTLFVNVEGNIQQYMSQFSADGKIYASLMCKHNDSNRPVGKETIKVWEVETGVEVCSITLPEDIQYSSVIALTSDGCILASNSGDQDKTVIVLSETLTGKEICRFPEFGWKDFVAKKLAEEESIGLKKFISSAFDKFLLIFSPKLSEMEINKQVLKSLELDREFRSIRPKQVVSLAFSPNDQLLASGHITGTINLWQLKKGSLEPPTKIWTWTIVSKQPITTLVFSQDGQTLATGQGDDNGAITLWDVKSGKKLQPLPGHRVKAFRIPDNPLISGYVAVSPDGKIIATGYGVIRLWNAQTGSCLRCLESKSDRHSFPSKITFSPRGKLLVSVHDREIVLWNVSTGEEIQSMMPDPDNVDPYNRRWGSRTLNQYGDLLAISEKSPNCHNVNLQIMQIPTGKIVCTLVTEDKFPSQIIFSPDKRLVATRHSISEFAIWEIATGRLIRTIINDIVENYSPTMAECGQSGINLEDSVLFSPDGEILAISGDENITLWQVNSGEKIHTINRYHHTWSSCLAFTPNGQILAFTESTPKSKTIKLWDVKNAKEICILEEGIYAITSLDFSGNGQVLMSVYRNDTISVWQQKKDLA